MKTLGDVSFALVRFLDAHLRGLDTCERVSALASYCQGLALDGVRKSLVAMAGRLEPDNAEGARQRMHRALHRGRFGYEEVFERLQKTAWRRQRGLRVFCIDDTGFAKKGKLSVGTKRQYSGTLGKTGNCQVAVSLHAVGPRQSLYLDMGLYLPREWAEDPARRRQAEVPDDVQFATKAEIALAQLRRVRERGGPSMPVLADAGYGDSREFRESIERMSLPYLVAVSSTGLMWPPGSKPQAPQHTGALGRPRSRARDPNGQVPVALATLAREAWARGAFRPMLWG